jgi:hypothetical protein
MDMLMFGEIEKIIFQLTIQIILSQLLLPLRVIQQF